MYELYHLCGIVEFLGFLVYNTQYTTPTHSRKLDYNHYVVPLSIPATKPKTTMDLHMTFKEPREREGHANGIMVLIV